jgi:DNA polymerase III delta subunit
MDQVDKELLEFIKGLSPEEFDRLKQELISLGAYHEDGSIPIIDIEDKVVAAIKKESE